MTNVAPKTYNFNVSQAQIGKNLHTSKDYEKNPHKCIVDYCTPFIDSIKLAPSKVLVATYRRPEVTAGGIYMAASNLDEDKWQGVAALVLKLGASAFKDDATTTFSGFEAKQFDWVTFKPSVGVAREFNGLHCRIVEDRFIDAVIDDPTLVW
jgi:co-chaperonin GroES (HSP10)